MRGAIFMTTLPVVFALPRSTTGYLLSPLRGVSGLIKEIGYYSGLRAYPNNPRGVREKEAGWDARRECRA